MLKLWLCACRQGLTGVAWDWPHTGYAMRTLDGLSDFKAIV